MGFTCDSLLRHLHELRLRNARFPAWDAEIQYYRRQLAADDIGVGEVGRVYLESLRRLRRPNADIEQAIEVSQTSLRRHRSIIGADDHASRLCVGVSRILLEPDELRLDGLAGCRALFAPSSADLEASHVAFDAVIRSAHAASVCLALLDGD